MAIGMPVGRMPNISRQENWPQILVLQEEGALPLDAGIENGKSQDCQSSMQTKQEGLV